MANIKISDLNSHTGSNLHLSDILPIVDLDVNDDGNTADAETKRISIAELKNGIFASPTFTGTVSGITPAMVQLGNVTNESKATMFTGPTFTGNPQSNAAPTSGDHLSNKTYVDSQVQQADGHTGLVKKVTGSEIMALTTTESSYITMIAAPGAGKFIVVRQLEVYIDRGSWSPMNSGTVRGYGDELQLVIKNPVVNQPNYQWNTYGVLQKKILNHLINNTFNVNADPDVILVRDTPVTQTRAYANVPLLLRPKSADTIGNLNTYSQTVDDDYYFRISYKIMDLSTDFAET